MAVRTLNAAAYLRRLPACSNMDRGYCQCAQCGGKAAGSAMTTEAQEDS